MGTSPSSLPHFYPDSVCGAGGGGGHLADPMHKSITCTHSGTQSLTSPLTIANKYPIWVFACIRRRSYVKDPNNAGHLENAGIQSLISQTWGGALARMASPNEAGSHTGVIALNTVRHYTTLYCPVTIQTSWTPPPAQSGQWGTPQVAGQSFQCKDGQSKIKIYNNEPCLGR